MQGLKAALRRTAGLQEPHHKGSGIPADALQPTSGAMAVAEASIAWRSRLHDLMTMIVAGGTAGCAMWALVLPIDGAKSRIQTAYRGSCNDAGLLQTLQRMWRSGGVRVLWAGLMPTLGRAFPANAAQWVAWELLRGAMQA